MPYKEREIKRKYFSIGEVASLLNVNTSLIRFWESEFEFINPKKNKTTQQGSFKEPRKG